MESSTKISWASKKYTYKPKGSPRTKCETDIRNFIGAMSGDTRKGIFVTTSSFDQKAVKKAHDAHHTIVLLDGEGLVDLMHKFNVGVQIKNSYEVKAVDSDFFDSGEV